MRKALWAFVLLALLSVSLSSQIAMAAGGFSLTQITTSSGCLNFSTSINADGTKIAFQSDCDGNIEIYRFDTTTSTLTQITTTSGCDSGEPSINAAGTKIALESGCNLTGTDSDGNNEIYRFDTATSTLTQITTTSSCETFSPSINADGTKIAFGSDCNLTGSDSDGNAEIYRFDITTSTLTQITTTSSGGNTSPSINADGTKIALESGCNLTGSNSDGNPEIYLALLRPARVPAPALSVPALLAVAVLLALMGSRRTRRRSQLR